jgi:glycerol-3-phosphate cytidylyltransferase
MNKKIGYATGVFDLFHIGHLNIFKKAKSKCDILIVGVATDALTEKLKNKKPVIPFEERCEILRSIKYIDKVVPQAKIDEISDQKKLGFNIIFKGSDWKGTEKWKELEKEFKKINVKVVYFPYTKTTSSTLINEFLSAELQKIK